MEQLRSLFYRTVISLLLISTPYYLLSNVLPPNRMLDMPAAPFPPSPLLEILILSFPRPNSSLILRTTISSYLPYVKNNKNHEIRMSVFTGAVDHPAFQHLETEFRGQDVLFYMDREKHPEAVQGQWLHLAEAFRWVSGKSATGNQDGNGDANGDPNSNSNTNERGRADGNGRNGYEQAEWVMLIEDDFPLCGGDAGWEAIVKVMSILEGERLEEAAMDNDKAIRKARLPKRRGAFVGTGGSGLIIHKTLLPTLIHVLRTYASKPRTNPIPPGVFKRPADLIIQDCLLGADPMCPPKTYNYGNFGNFGVSGSGLLITSRLVMDHIGGLSSTNTYKLPNSDQWRCGWRHPFHGLPEVQVVPVEGLW